jgi:hypothetical protein
MALSSNRQARKILGTGANFASASSHCAAGATVVVMMLVGDVTAIALVVVAIVFRSTYALVAAMTGS